MTFRPLLNVRFSLHLEITHESSFSNIFTLGVFCAFLDASKAFDTVLHCGLLVKLQKKNISLSFVQILRNWYRKLNASVLWNGVYGRIFPILCGVRQGGVLSPILFSMFIVFYCVAYSLFFFSITFDGVCPSLKLIVIVMLMMISYNICASLAVVYM